MNKAFIPIAPRHYADFFQSFPGADRKELCQGCDGRSVTGDGLFTPVCLLPGELTFLKERGTDLEPLLDRVSTPHGTMYCLDPATACPYRRNDPSPRRQAAPLQPVECTIYPLIFSRHGSDELRVDANCRRQNAFLQDDFSAKARVAVAVYLLPYLEEAWLRYRNELNIALRRTCYHRLKKEKAGQPMTLEELKECAADPIR